MKRVLLATLALTAIVPLVRAQSDAPRSSRWEVVSSWGNLPAGTEWGGATQASANPDGQIVIFRRAVPAFFIVSPDGKLVKSFGDTKYRAAHGVRVDREGFIWATDNADNFVQKLSPDGQVLMTLGKAGTTGDNDSQDMFDGPADVFVAPNGDILVADGYRNSRVVQFSKDGKFIRKIGGVKGSEPGQFNSPHSVVVDSRGRIIVADVENSRLQVFDASGKFVEQWTGFAAKPRTRCKSRPMTPVRRHVDSESITVMKDGKVIESITNLGLRPHGVTMDRQGALYLTSPLLMMVHKVVRK
jgi:DNA-binding beta-propeller fold protein YncE